MAGLSDSSSQAAEPTVDPLPWCPWKPPTHSSLWGCLHIPSRVHPPGQAAGIPKSICLLSCRGNRAQQMGPSRLPPEPASRLLVFTALPRSLRAGLVLLSPNTVHCSVPASTKHSPDGQGPQRACLPPALSTARSLPEAQGDAQSLSPQPKARQGQRKAGNRLSPALGTHTSFSQSPSDPDPSAGKARACLSLPTGLLRGIVEPRQTMVSVCSQARQLNWSSLGFNTRIIMTLSCMNLDKMSPFPHRGVPRYPKH